jgi:hypothetical protein
MKRRIMHYRFLPALGRGGMGRGIGSYDLTLECGHVVFRKYSKMGRSGYARCPECSREALRLSLGPPLRPSNHGLTDKLERPLSPGGSQ